MEYMSGGSLAHNLEIFKQFSENQVKFFAAEITCGLLYLHSERIIHLFFKFSKLKKNILL